MQRIVNFIFLVIFFTVTTDAFVHRLRRDTGGNGPVPLNNNPSWRSFSDKLDDTFKWGGYDDPRQSKVRATLHAGYHELQHLKSGNPREHARAQDQWCVARGNGPCNNLKNYDQQNFQH